MASIHNCEAKSCRRERDREENLKDLVCGHDATKIRNCYLHLQSTTLTLVFDKTPTAGLRQKTASVVTANVCCVAVKVDPFCKFFLWFMLFINVYYYLVGQIITSFIFQHYFSYAFNSISVELYLAQKLFLHYTLFSFHFGTNLIFRFSLFKDNCLHRTPSKNKCCAYWKPL